MMTTMLKTTTALLAAAMATSALAAPSKCARDLADGHVHYTNKCSVKCLAIGLPGAPEMETLDKRIPTEVTGYQVRGDTGVGALVAGVPCVTTHGGSCVPLKNVRFVTPCDLKKLGGE
jgi:hypothetical protein